VPPDANVGQLRNWQAESPVPGYGLTTALSNRYPQSRCRVVPGGHSNDSVRTPEEIVEEAWVIGKEQLKKVREERERLAREQEQKRQAKKSEPDSSPAYHPNSIQAILGRWDSGASN
jgi:hypothetical protein